MKEVANFKWTKISELTGRSVCTIDTNFKLVAENNGSWAVFCGRRRILEGKSKTETLDSAKFKAIDGFFGYILTLFKAIKRQFKVDYFS